ncbi:MAG: hypothetical protein J6Y91_03385, partial [Alphaproteobacteria bacterium]|nr:hypothetical protein [Alphaproteobacteria bacterium]
MEKFFKWLYYYCLILFSAFVVYMFIVMSVSPRSDALKRGFVSCTEQLVTDISECPRGKMSCSLKYLWQNTKCNVTVVLSGFGAWVKGKQPTPWANYLYEPVTTALLDEESSKYGAFPENEKEFSAQYDRFQRQNQQDEEIMERYLNLKKDVLRSDVEAELKDEKLKDWPQDDALSDETVDDISAEVFTDVVSGGVPQDGSLQIKRPDIVKNLQKITEEKLKQENLKDE